MLYILGFKNSNYDMTTPRHLAEDFNAFTFINRLKHQRFTLEDYLVRYGITYFPDKDYDCKRVINNARAIRAARNKLFNMKILLRNNIPVPKVFFDKNDITENDLPVFRRKQYHSRGKDIIIINSLRKRIPDGDFYTKYVPSNREYRVLVYGDEALRIQLKHKDANDDDMIKNTDHGYFFLNIFEHHTPIEKTLIQIAIRAVQVSGLDFGAVDLLVSKDNKPYVLEVNSAPRLNRSGRELLSLSIFEDLGIEFNMNQFYRIKPNNRLRELPLRFVTHKRKRGEQT